MRTLIVAAFVSLDGVMQAPGGPDEDTSGGFRFGGWIVPYGDALVGEAVQALFAQPFDLLLGRRTYDIFANYWPHVPADAGHRGLADTLNGATKHVATHRPGPLAWQHSHKLEGDVADAIRVLKRGEGPPLLTQGSGDLVRQLLAAGLVDALQLIVYPVMLGQGKRLFGDDAHAAAFRVTHAATTPLGVQVTRYARSGEVRTGSFET